MSSNLNRVGIVGASGNLGPYILKALKADPAFKITVITRHSSKSSYPDSDFRVIKVADDYPKEELVKAFQDQDTVIASLNHKANPFQKNMIDAAIAAGVKRYIPSDFGSNGGNKALFELEPWFNGKSDIVDYLRSKESQSFTWTSIITGLFIEMAIPNGFMGFNVKDRIATMWDLGSARFSVSICSTIGATVAAVLRNPEVTKNRYVYTSSVETTQTEILHELEKQTGGHPWKIEDVKSDDMLVAAKEAVQKGDFPGGARLALVGMYSGKYGANFEAEGKLDNAALGVPKVGLGEIIAGSLQDFLGQADKHTQNDYFWTSKLRHH